MPERERRRVGFELHRVVEYLVAVGVLSVFISDRARRPALGVLGGALLVLAATTRGGRLAVRRWLPHGTHRALDVVLVVGMAGAPLIPGLGGLYVAQYLIPSAAVLAWLITHTTYRSGRTAAGTGSPDKASAPRRRVQDPSPAEPAAPVRSATSTAPDEPTVAENLGRFAGRLAAKARRASRN